ncbi:MAG: CDP-alcohol phosphatidyltransferase family protein [Chloroflexi bacterium]|nr:MAG: CDP-alcohol phosphatidyltransferase family protein [Chloroflexota bacterium]
MACGTAFSGRGRRTTLLALLLGCTVCDWLDGPLARRLGPTPLGAALDLSPCWRRRCATRWRPAPRCRPRVRGSGRPASRRWW